METLPLATLEYTPAWCSKNLPGFCKVECYNIFADHSLNPEKYVQVDEGVEEQNEDDYSDDNYEHVNKKAKIVQETAAEKECRTL